MRTQLVMASTGENETRSMPGKHQCQARENMPPVATGVKRGKITAAECRQGSIEQNREKFNFLPLDEFHQLLLSSINEQRTELTFTIIFDHNM